jgi:menaquinone-dependent protoporphyrinogen oxidase
MEVSAVRVLLVYGTERAGTSGIAEIIGDTLAAAGIEADVRPAEHRVDVARYDAVIVGGALYAGRWHRYARRFVKRHLRRLRERPVWLFSSGPLDDSAAVTDIPPVSQVDRLMADIGARGHITFGGRLEPSPAGFVAARMARTRAGDWRDPDRIRGWATGVAAELLGLPRPA